MSDHLETKHKLKEDVAFFRQVVECDLLGEEQKALLKLIYIEQKDYRWIGDMFGVSESTIKKRHRDLLKKVNKILKAGL